MISSFGRGGAPALIVNYMTHLTDENIKFDFLLRAEKNAFESEIKNHGIKFCPDHSFFSKA